MQIERYITCLYGIKIYYNIWKHTLETSHILVTHVIQIWSDVCGHSLEQNHIIVKNVDLSLHSNSVILIWFEMLIFFMLKKYLGYQIQMVKNLIWYEKPFFLVKRFDSILKSLKYLSSNLCKEFCNLKLYQFCL